MIERIITDLEDLKVKLKTSQNYTPSAKATSLNIVDSVIRNIYNKVPKNLFTSIGRTRINSVLNNISQNKINITKEVIHTKINVIVRNIVNSKDIDDALTNTSVNQLNKIKLL